MRLRFIYTNMPFWRAEVSRIALFIGDLEFEDLRIDREEFLRAKESGKLDDGTVMTFHQMPVLVVDGTSIAQQVVSQDFVENYLGSTQRMITSRPRKSISLSILLLT